MSEPKKQKQKDYKPQPSANGVMTCGRGHLWDVVDLNPELKSVKCPVCGTLTPVAGGLEKK